jgi:protein-L-isoaspartate(D-aspartate) O-methyltransferase
VGPRQNDLPTAVISFYDDERQELGMFSLGPHKGTKDWFTQSRVIRIPRSAREGIVRIGLWGATGTARFDNVTVEAVKK